MTAPLVELSRVRVQRGTFTLEVPHWRVYPGRVVGVVGPNGAGKTTLLRLLPGLDAADSGQIRVLGRDPIVDPVFVRQALGFMSDDMAVFSMKVGKLLRTASGYYPGWDAALVDDLLERFKLDPGKRTQKLSKGEGTRLRLILALAFRPKILVLDEPATGLDVGGRRALLETVLDLLQDPQTSVIISSHQLQDLERIADELLVVQDGEILREGNTTELIGDHRTLEEAVIAWGAAGC